MIVSQDEYNVAKQQARELHAKINLLNFNFQTVDELSGVVLPSSTYSIDSTSDIRRTCNISLIPIDSSFDIAEGNKIWLDKYIQVYIGIKNILTSEIIYTNMGIYLVDNPTRVYDPANNTMTIKGVDLMAKMTGLRNGNLEGIDYVIPSGYNVRKAIIAAISLAGFTKYSCVECPYTVPNQITIESGGTVYDILKKLQEITAEQYQMYFDVDGVFHYDKVPNGVNDQVVVDDDIWNAVLIDYSISNDFDNIKNHIEVYGKTHDIKYYGGTATVNGSQISCSISTLKKLRKNIKLGFTMPETFTLGSNPTLQVTGYNSTVFTSYPIMNDTGTTHIASTQFVAGKYYVCKMILGDDYATLATSSTVSNNVATLNSTINEYDVTISSITAYTNGMTFTFKTPSTGCDVAYNPTIRVNALDALEIQSPTLLENDTSYTVTVTIQSDDTSKMYFYFMGEVNPSGVAEETNPESPFYINGTMGSVRLVLQGGDYDNIYTSELAQIRANWELYNYCRLQDSITIDVIPLYWLDVNTLISITLPNKQGTSTTEEYLVKQISTTLDITGTQSIQLMKFYPFYPST